MAVVNVIVIIKALLASGLLATLPQVRGGEPLDPFETDDTPEQSTFLAGFDSTTPDAPLVISQSHWFHNAVDEDWVSFASTVQFVELTIQACQGTCADGNNGLDLNVQVFTSDLIGNPAPTPVAEANPCTPRRGPSDPPLIDLSNQFAYGDDEIFFVRVRECNGLSGAALPYELVFSRDSIGADVALVTGRVLARSPGGTAIAAPALAIVQSNFNDLTLADPVTGDYAVLVNLFTPNTVMTAEVPGIGSKSVLIGELTEPFAEIPLDFQVEDIFVGDFED